MTDPADELYDSLRKVVSIDDMPRPPKPPTRAQQLAPSLNFDELWRPVETLDMPIPNMGIAPGPVHLVTGSWFTGKTVFLILLGLAVASGRPVLNLGPAKLGRWAHFDHEMGERGFRRYLQRVTRGLGLRVDDLRGRLSAHILPKLNLCTDGAEDMYVELLAGYDVATFDPLRVLIPGKDENSSEFRQWLDMLGRVSLRANCSIIVLHHAGKPAQGGDRKHTGRGSSAIDDAVQSKFVLTAASKGAPVVVSHEKTRERKDMKLLDDFYFRFVNTEDAVRLEPMTKEEFEGWADSKYSDAVRQAILSVGGTFVGTRDDLLDLCTGDRRRLSPELTRMVSTGDITSEGRGAERRWSIRYSV